MVKIAFYSILLALLIAALYVAVKVAEAYVKDKERFSQQYFISNSPGTWIEYLFNGREIKEQVLVRGFKPVFAYFPETGEIVFENVNGLQFHVHTDVWELITVPEETDYVNG